MTDRDAPAAAPFPYRLQGCVWELTLACSFRCAYCGSGGGKARKNELTTEECAAVAAALADLGCRRVSLIGGEVFLRSDWAAVLSELTGRGIRVCVITNGFSMTPETVGALRAGRVESVAVSLDAPEAAHDAMRAPGSFRAAIAAIGSLTAAGIPTSVVSALRADTVALLPALYETLRRYPLAAWQLQACSPMGNAEKNGLDIRFRASDALDFVRRIRDVSAFPVGIADNIGYFTEDDETLRGGVFRGCGAGLTQIGIDSVGNVRGCESLYDDRFIEGNLRERTLRDIWEDPDAFAYNRRFTPSLLTGACAACPKGAVCAGGCRSYNYFANGGKLYENPLCVRREKGPWSS